MGMNLNSRSCDDLTPLHWACLANSEVAMIYLLAWYPIKAINFQDNEGNTALHLSIKSAGQIASGRPMR
jgi:ankyrin repeat protein